MSGRQIMTAEEIRRATTRISHEIVEKQAGTAGLVLVGIQRRGVPLARRIAQSIAEHEGVDVLVGALDITFYRDDLSLVAQQPLVKGTDLPFDLNESTIVLGTAAQIRAYAAAHHPDLRPDFQFTDGDSRGWSRWSAQPSPAPSAGLSMAPTGDDPQFLGPDEWFRTADVPTLYIRGAWHTHDTLAHLYWRGPGETFVEQRSVQFRVVDDGLMHTYAIPLSGQLLYTGTIARAAFN